MTLDCEFCGKKGNKMVKCVQCQLIMCQACKCNIHSKIRGSSGHTSEIIRICSRYSRLSKYLFFSCCKRVPEVHERTRSGPIANKQSYSRYNYRLQFDEILNTNYANDVSQQRELSNRNVLENGQPKETTHNDHVAYNDKLKVIKSFVVDISAVSRVIRCLRNIIWITRASDEMLQMLRVEKDQLITAAIFDIKAYDMAMTSVGELLIATSESVLKIITKDGHEIQNSKYDVSPFLPTSIHFSRTGRVVVGVMQTGTAFPVSGERKLIVFNINGVQEESIGYDDQNEPLFTYIYSICSDKNNCLYVLDRMNRECHGRIVILNRKGSVSNIYRGHHIFNMVDKFKPKDIAVTNSENIVIAETYKHVLHVINRHGHLLQYLNIRDVLGITYPQSLDLSYRNHLVIGTSRKGGSVDKSKIHFVNVSNNNI